MGTTTSDAFEAEQPILEYKTKIREVACQKCTCKLQRKKRKFFEGSETISSNHDVLP